MTKPIATRLNDLRALMKQHKIDYYFVPSRDAHNDEYLPDCWQRRAFISGFDGSAGDVLVGLDSAYLWTDPRYFLQAEQQLDHDCFTLMKQLQGVDAPIHKWLAENAAKKRVATDPKLLSIHEQKLWDKALKAVDGELVAIGNNLIDAIWNNQPTLPTNPAHALDLTYTGLSTTDKLKAVRIALQEQHVTAHALNLLDAIAWLFNIRGSDIAYNPLAISYALITSDQATLYIDQNKLDTSIKQQLQKEGVMLADYNDFGDALKNLNQPTLLESTSASWWMGMQLGNDNVILDSSPITLMKAIKNPTEQNGMREAHRRDGLALTKTFHWLASNWPGQTELSIAKQMAAFRGEDDDLRGLSFRTISGFADHGAIIHYGVTPETDRTVDDSNLLLLDSGGQYLQGTTDVTRTVHLGTPSAKQVHHYTLVLKGHLALRHTTFVHGTCGEQLNAIAHLPLWSEGLDYGHGTGHGVGCYLCVHEGPQRISGAYTRVPIVPGMIVSNEPGLYLENQYGIRIENLLLTVLKFDTKDSESGHGPFYAFDDLTLFPYAKNLIDTKMLTTNEIEQINQYHEITYQTLSPNLSPELQTWLKAATEAL